MADGIGCECFAKSAGECCCEGVDWTPKEVVELRAEKTELLTLLAEARENDRTAMYYLGQIRGIVGGDDFPDMVRRVAELESAKAENVKLREELERIKREI